MVIPQWEAGLKKVIITADSEQTLFVFLLHPSSSK